MSYAELWDAQAADLPAARWAAWADPDEAQHTLRHLLHLADMPTAGSLLDLGCGWGRLAIPMGKAQPAATVWAVDVSQRMLDHLSDTAEAEGAGNLRPLLCNGRRLPEQLPRLAGAWSMLMFQHVPADQQRSYLHQLAQQLRPVAPLVVQFVTDTEQGPLSNPVEPDTMLQWATDAGLVADVRTDDQRPTWRWLHARKVDHR